MLAHQRQDFILRKVVTNGGVRVSHVVAELGVSDMTIRRDIDALVAKGLVTKVHGGAIPIRQGGADAYGVRIGPGLLLRPRPGRGEPGRRGHIGVALRWSGGLCGCFGTAQHRRSERGDQCPGRRGGPARPDAR